ncbi:MAG TPA: Rieske 2Fe-2S domain-containing protein [Steroidobacteraceae bacterium]|nr:Rieske 2Fe-2S domain-containing protein [Steroidobacteraceae bacterium]
MSAVLPAGTRLGRVTDLPDGATREFVLDDTGWPLTGFLVRVGEAVHAYLNRCPHALRQLNFRPDRFLSPDGTLIQCSSHGALFEKDTGLCVAGPCVGESLRRLPVELIDGELRLTEDLDTGKLDRQPFLP